MSMDQTTEQLPRRKPLYIIYWPLPAPQLPFHEEGRLAFALAEPLRSVGARNCAPRCQHLHDTLLITAEGGDLTQGSPCVRGGAP